VNAYGRLWLLNASLLISDRRPELKRDRRRPRGTARARRAARLRETGADGLVCFPSRNLQYLTGFAEEPGERHLLLVVPAADRSSDTPDGGDQTAAEPTPRAGPPRAGPLRDAGQGGDHGRCGADVGRRRRPDRRRPGPPRRPDSAKGGSSTTTRCGRRSRRTSGPPRPTRSGGLASEALADLRARKDEAELDAMRRRRGADETVGTSAISARTRSG